VAAVLIAWPAATSPLGDALAVLGGVAGLVLLAGLLFGYPPAIAWALAGLGLEFVLSLYARHVRLDLASVFFAGGLLVTAELAYWSLQFVDSEGESVITADSSALFRRGSTIAGLCLGSVSLAILLYLVALSPFGGSLFLTAVGVAATVAALGIVSLSGNGRGPG
jgi:hypothetical protein